MILGYKGITFLSEIFAPDLTKIMMLEILII